MKLEYPNGDDLSQVQRLRKAVLAGIALLLMAAAILSDAMAENLERKIELSGWLAIGICIVGRTWSGLYIAGRKNKSVVRFGPYSIVRNPLYVFSIVGAAGVGLAFGSLTAGFLLGLVVLVVFHLVLRQEEEFLSDRFGPDYRRYLAEVPRWVPDFSLWQEAEEVLVSPRVVIRIFLDALLFSLAIPLFEGLELLQNGGVVPVLLRLP